MLILEGSLPLVHGPPRQEVHGAVEPGELPGLASFRRDDEELGVLALEGDERDLPAIRAPANAAARGFSVREPLLMGPVDVHDMDVRHAALLADIGDAPAIGRDVRAVAGAMLILRREPELDVMVADREPAEIVTVDADPIDVAVAAEEDDGLAVRSELGTERVRMVGREHHGSLVGQPDSLQAVSAAGPEQTTASPAGLSAAMYR